MTKAELELEIVSVRASLQRIIDLLNPVALRNLTVAAHTLIQLGVDMASGPHVRAKSRQSRRRKRATKRKR